MKTFLKCSKGRTLRSLLSMLCLALLFPVMAMAQTKASGVVYDDLGEPVIGASIIEKGTTNGTVTDLDGNFELNVKSGAVLQVSFVGYATQEVKAAANMKITLKEDAELLEETVVVGYGVQKKSSLTGAVSQVKSEDMEARTITNATQALQGKTSGVQILSSSAKPGASPSVRIRGISSNGDSSPLYVVDGRIASDIAGIDPNDIESMEVLKDGASAAIYGAAAGNGVILITTKKGKGDGKITYDFQLTSQSLGRVPKVMNAEQYIDYYVEAGKITMDAFYRNWDNVTNTDWVNEAFENSMMKRHNVTFQAGSDKGSLYISLSHLDNNGMIVGNADTYERLTGMINASWKIKPWLEIGTNNQIEKYNSSSVSEGSEYGSMLLSVLQLDPLTKPVYEKGQESEHMQSLLNSPDKFKHNLLQDENGNYYGISPFVTSENSNPYVMRDNSRTKSTGFNINGTTFLNFTPIKGLTVTSRLSYRLSSSSSYGVSNDFYYNDTNKRNYISVSASDYSPVYWQWENFLNYMRSFGKHTGTVMLGTSYSESTNFGVSGSMQGDDTDKGFLQDDPNFLYFAYASSSANRTLSGGERTFGRKLAYFGRLNYDYAGKYIAQFSLRADAADLAVLPMEKRWGYFPAGSLGWTISQEDFMESTREWLSMLKVRASWGQNGSTASLGGYRWNVTIGSTGHLAVGDNNTFNYINGYAPSATGNKDLKWETSEQTNFGIDARMFRDRLTFSVDYFKKETKDLLVSGIKASTVVGNTFSPVNAGNIENSGLELELGWQDRIGDFRYGIRANMSTLKNKVTYLHESLDALDGASFHTYGAITRFEIGKPAWYFYGYKYTGINKENGEPMFEDLDGDGVIGQSDKTEIGSGIPDVTYGVTLTAGWKGLDFIVFGSGSAGNDIYCCLNRGDYTVNKLSWYTEDRWTKDNPNGSKPGARADISNYMTSSAAVMDGSYFKIKQIQLGYNLPKKWLKKAYMDNCRVYGSLEDYFTFTSYEGFDPEVTGVGSSLGVDKGSYPTSKKVVFGLSLTF